MRNGTAACRRAPRRNHNTQVCTPCATAPLGSCWWAVIVSRLVGVRCSVSSQEQAVYRYVNNASCASVPTSPLPVTGTLTKMCPRTGLDPGTRTIGRPVTCVSTARRAPIGHHLGGNFISRLTERVRKVCNLQNRTMNPVSRPRQLGGNWWVVFIRREARAISARRSGPAGPSFIRLRRESSLVRPLPRSQEPRPRCPRLVTGSAVRSGWGGLRRTLCSTESAPRRWRRRPSAPRWRFVAALNWLTARGTRGQRPSVLCEIRSHRRIV
jgi:hypothetical protein